MQHRTTGLNISSFYHFNEHWNAGIEMNRFFTKKIVKEDEDIETAAWDFDCNIHYNIPVGHHFNLYPLTGISHTSEKERLDGDNFYNRFWSFNTGAGLLWTKGKWAPHVEYNFTWGKINQQFLLAGISYEIEF
jgi:hypothetical protein